MVQLYYPIKENADSGTTGGGQYGIYKFKKAVQAMQIKFKLFNHYIFFIIRKSNRKKPSKVKPARKPVVRLSNYQKAQARIKEIKQFINKNEQASRRNHGVY